MKQLMDNRTVGQIIQTYREEAGLSQEELAEMIHVTKGKVSHWENNETIPRASMVGRLIGALDIPDEILIEAVHLAEDQKRQGAIAEKAEYQKMLSEALAEKERLEHKKRAIMLVTTGAIGFIGGCIFAVLRNAPSEAEWYFPLMIGALLAGLPYGIKMLFGNSKISIRNKYENTRDYETRYRRSLTEWVLIFVAYGFLFFLVWLIGFLAYPVVLTYHAYKAGKKKTVYRTIMFTVFLLTVLVYGAIALFILLTAASG